MCGAIGLSFAVLHCGLSVEGMDQGTCLVELRKKNPRWELSAWADSSLILDDDFTLGRGFAENAGGVRVSEFDQRDVEAIRVVDYCDRVFSWQEYYAPRLNESETRLKELSHLGKLRYLGFDGGVGLRDSDLLNLAGLTAISTLEISGERWTSPSSVESSTKPIVGEGYRRARYRWHTITDDGLVHIAKLTNLMRLVLECSEVTDAGVERLAAISGLRYLTLNGCAISGECVKALRVLRELEEMECRDTSFEDQSVDHLVSMKSLRLVDLSGTAITDIGLSRLRLCPSLETIYAFGTRCTRRAAERLNAQRVADGKSAISVFGAE
jgi:hypothetical protein